MKRTEFGARLHELWNEVTDVSQGSESRQFDASSVSKILRRLRNEFDEASLGKAIEEDFLLAFRTADSGADEGADSRASLSVLFQLVQHDDGPLVSRDLALRMLTALDPVYWYGSVGDVVAKKLTGHDILSVYDSELDEGRDSERCFRALLGLRLYLMRVLPGAELGKDHPLHVRVKAKIEGLAAGPDSEVARLARIILTGSPVSSSFGSSEG